jgi:hypothetical protein
MEPQELNFGKIEIIKVGSLQKKTLRILPQGKNRLQKIAVGDKDGIVRCFSLKKNEVSVSHPSLHFQLT